MDSPKIPHIADYDTGYKKPPKTSQFKKGKSGNPSGRPKGVLNRLPKDELRLQDLFIKEAYRDVPIKEGSKRIKLPVIAAAMRSLAIKAAQGNIRAQKLLLDHLTRIEDKQEKDKLEFFGEMADYKFKAEKMIADAKKKGATLEHEFIPHPDHITLNPYTGEVVIKGPLTPDEKKLWDGWWKDKIKHQIHLEVWRDLRPKDKRGLEIQKIFIAHTQFFLEMTEQALINQYSLNVEDVVKDISRRAEMRRRLKQNKRPPTPKTMMDLDELLYD